MQLRFVYYGRGPKPPPGLDRYARDAWNRHAPALVRLGLLTEQDVDLLAAYAATYSQWRRASEALQVMDVTDDQYRRVAVTVEKGRHDLRLIGAEFGLSPASRSRISVPDPGDVDEFEAYLRRG